MLAIHNASKIRILPEKFIAWYVAHLSDTVSYELSPEKNEPIENPNYPIRVQEVTDELQDLKKKLEETDDPDKQADLEDKSSERKISSKVLRTCNGRFLRRALTAIAALLRI